MNGVANGLYGGDLPNQINTPWIDFSEQSTIVGWSSFTQKTIRYKVVGNIMYVVFNIVGTSNSTSTTFTLPILRDNKLGPQNQFFINARDNSGVSAAGMGSIGSGNTVSFFRDTGFNAWTASGAKHIIGQFFYEI